METSRRRDYLALTKPGIIGGNAISVLGGFFLAARGEIDPWLLMATLAGLSLVIASGCAYNNVIDRDIDAVMERTRSRPLVQGRLSVAETLRFATLLGVAGFGLLAAFTNAVTVGLAAFGFAIYVGAYSLWLKRSSEYGTLVGSLSGAMPPVVGYCAVTGQFDGGALTLLVIFCLWQMPHSYAIAIFRFKDYEAARIPVLPVVRGIGTAKHPGLRAGLRLRLPGAERGRLCRAGLLRRGAGDGRLLAVPGHAGLLDHQRRALGQARVRVLHPHHHRAERDDVGGIQPVADPSVDCSPGLSRFRWQDPLGLCL